MSSEEQGFLLTLDPDGPSGRPTRSRSARVAVPQAPESAPAVHDPAVANPAEATLNLEPLRLPITAIVRTTLVAERAALQQLGDELRAELAHLHDWRIREEAMRADQTALYRDAANAWEAAGDQATALGESARRLAESTHSLHVAIDRAIGRFWRRILLAGGVLALVGLALVAGLCGVVWLALANR
jgi:hypothetical protein